MVPERSATASWNRESSRERSAVAFFTYSIRFSMLTDDEQRAADPHRAPLASAQLLSRHWCGRARRPGLGLGLGFGLGSGLGLGLRRAKLRVTGKVRVNLG